MNWEVVQIPSNKKGRTAPYASVGNGRLSISAASCELITNYDKYTFAELLRGKDGKNPCVGVRLLKEATPNSLAIKRKKIDGKFITGMEISNKNILLELFGLTATAKKMTRFDVKKDPDADNILIVFTKP